MLLIGAWLLALRVMAVGFFVTWVFCTILSGAPEDLNEKPQQTEAKLAAMDKARALGIDKDLDSNSVDLLAEGMKLVTDLGDQLRQGAKKIPANGTSITPSSGTGSLAKPKDVSVENAKKTVMHALVEQMLPDALKKDAELGELVLLSPRHG